MSTEEVNRAAQRRARREAAQADAKETAKSESLRQANPAAKSIDARRKEQDAAITKPIADAPSVDRKTAKKQAKARAQVAARQQAVVDALRQPTPAPDLVRPGETPPLHILRQRAKEVDRAMRDEAREIAQTLAENAEDLINGRMPRDRHTRRRRQAEAESRAALVRGSK